MIDPKEILKKYWGYDAFRPPQEEIVQAALDGKDILALLPTGGGKSICFQVPALCLEGICVVVTPLIALMKDQVENLQRRGIKAMYLHSGMSFKEIDLALNNAVHGDFKFLYLSPERLTTEIFRVRFQQMKVSLIAVDEAHCISQWGHDFRPEYQRIAEIRELQSKVPVMALTATATPEVVEDIMVSLAFREKNVARISFLRKNLSYLILREEDKLAKLERMLKGTGGSAIVFTRNRKRTVEVAQRLRYSGFRSDFYHAGLKGQVRDQKQERWVKGESKVMVCTNAFGMGIDKPDVRLVVHLDLPESPEAYFQEAGRAGRDGKEAYCALLFDEADIRDAEKKLEQLFPTQQQVRMVYDGLWNMYRIAYGAGAGLELDFEITELLSRVDVPPLTVPEALKTLEAMSIVRMRDAFWQPSRVKLEVHKQELYYFQVANRAYDALLTALLRLYGGLFDNYTIIQERQLARKLELPEAEVIRQLEELAQAGILEYKKASDSPGITFLSSRLPGKDLLILPEHLEERKARFEKRFRAMLRMLTEPYWCRSVFLLSYFGEQTLRFCGKCDVCRGLNKQEYTWEDYKRSGQPLLDQLKKGALPLQSYWDRLNEQERIIFPEVLRYLLAEEVVKLLPDQTLSLG